MSILNDFSYFLQTECLRHICNFISRSSGSISLLVFLGRRSSPSISYIGLYIPESFGWIGISCMRRRFGGVTNDWPEGLWARFLFEDWLGVGAAEGTTSSSESMMVKALARCLIGVGVDRSLSRWSNGTHGRANFGNASVRFLRKRWARLSKSFWNGNFSEPPSKLLPI